MKYDVNKMKYEYKYKVSYSKLSELRERISPFTISDSNMDFGGENGYTVRSIYFDTPKYDFYQEKKEGLRIRKKIRIRGYNHYDQKNIIFLEIKRKNEKKIYKNRAAIHYNDLQNFLITCDSEKYIIPDHNVELAIENSQQFLFHIHRNSLLPAVLVIYEREAFFGKFDRSLRITLDKNIRGTIFPDIYKLYEEKNIKYPIPNYFILEVKFYHIFPSWMSTVIESMNLGLQPFSKYTNCIDANIVIHNNTRMLKYNFTQTVHV